MNNNNSSINNNINDNNNNNNVNQKCNNNIRIILMLMFMSPASHRRIPKWLSEARNCISRRRGAIARQAIQHGGTQQISGIASLRNRIQKLF